MARQRITRKDLKQPDRFISTTGHVLDWIRTHTHYVVGGILGVLVIIALVVGWMSWQRQRQQRASALLQQAITLDEPAAGTEAANAPEAIEKLKEITQDYGGTSAGAHAYLRLGHLYFDQGDTAAALAAYEQARQRLPRHEQISRSIAALNIGYAQEVTGACDQAISSFESVRQSTITWLHGEAYLGIGRCQEQSGATEKAIETYNQALADAHVTETTRQTINDRLALLQPPSPASQTSQAPSETPAPSPNTTEMPDAQHVTPEVQPTPPLPDDNKPEAAQ